MFLSINQNQWTLPESLYERMEVEISSWPYSEAVQPAPIGQLPSDELCYNQTKSPIFPSQSF